jgi:hypothetical protein
MSRKATTTNQTPTITGEQLTKLIEARKNLHDLIDSLPTNELPLAYKALVGAALLGWPVREPPQQPPPPPAKPKQRKPAPKKPTLKVVH